MADNQVVTEPKSSASFSVASRPNMGSLVYVRYLDHMIFRNMYPELAKPIVQEAWGQLDYEDHEYIRLVVARYQEPENSGKRALKATGLVILKKTILEMRTVA